MSVFGMWTNACKARWAELRMLGQQLLLHLLRPADGLEADSPPPIEMRPFAKGEDLGEVPEHGEGVRRVRHWFMRCEGDAMNLEWCEILMDEPRRRFSIVAVSSLEVLDLNPVPLSVPAHV